jgi:integrase
VSTHTALSTDTALSTGSNPRFYPLPLLVEKSVLIPTLAEFCSLRFEPWAKSNFENGYRSTWLWYRSGIKMLLAFQPLASLPLDEIHADQVAEFVAHCQSQKSQTSSVNNSLGVLRRMLRLAVDRGILEAAPKIGLVPARRSPERVVTQEEELRYLNAAPQLLAAVATLLIDTGLHPDECYKLRWEGITWTDGRNGSLFVSHCKTAAARRVLPMTPRVRVIIEERWVRRRQPWEGWLWPAPNASGHIEHFSLKKDHRKALQISRVRPFLLQSLRHTFLTRLAESGCDARALARLAGHGFNRDFQRIRTFVAGRGARRDVSPWWEQLRAQPVGAIGSPS